MTALRTFRTAVDSSIPIGTLFECEPGDLPVNMAQTVDIRPSTINIPASALTPAVFDLIHSAGATPVVWTPNETNPDELVPSERNKLVKTLRERNFVTITDFPKEILHWLNH